MTQEDLIFIETDLVFVINAFLEGLESPKREQYIRNYILDFCLKHNLSIDETLEKLNPLLQYNFKVKKDIIVPNEKEEQSALIEKNFFKYATNNNAIGKEKEIQTLLNNFCNITGIDSDFASSVYTKKIDSIKDFLENNIYDYIMDFIKELDNPQQKLKDFITEVSQILEVPSDFIVSLLKSKYMEENSKNTSSTPSSKQQNTTSFPTDVDDDGR